MHCECVHSNRCVVMGALSGCVVVDVPPVGNVGSGVQAGPGGDGRDPHMHWPCARRGCSCPDLSVCCCRSRPGLRLWPDQKPVRPGCVGRDSSQSCPLRFLLPRPSTDRQTPRNRRSYFMLADQADHVLGIDTHRDSHSAAILATDTGVVQGQITVAANERGYRRLLRFAREKAPGRRAWAVGGTGTYGAGLTVFLQREGELVLEVDRPRRPARRDRAKSDQLDAIRAAREALTREHLARPRQRGEREALRVLLATRDSAVRSKRAAITLMKGLLVSAAPALREGLRSLPTNEQLTRCARLRISPTQDSEQRATTIAIRASARRALALQDEALELEAEIKPIVTDLAPWLLAEMGVGAIVAAQILCAYSHHGRIRS